MKKLKKKEIQRVKSPRPPETKNIPLERIARGTVTATSERLFQVKFSKKTRKKEYNKPRTEYPDLDEEEKYIKKEEFILFRKKDSLPGTYNPPSIHKEVYCIYHGDKKHLFPYKVLDLNNNLLFQENSSLEKKTE